MCEPPLEMMPLPQSFEARQNGTLSPNPRASKTPEPQIKSSDNLSTLRLNNSSTKTHTELSSQRIPIITSTGEIENEELEGLKKSKSAPIQEEVVPNSSPANSLSPRDLETIEESISTLSREEPIPNVSPTRSSPLMEAAQVPQVPTIQGMETTRRPTRQSTRQLSRLKYSITAEELDQQSSPPEQVEVTPATRTLRKRKLQKELPSEDELWRTLTEEERRAWEGWAEITSEPALFNHILKGHGVKDVKIKELLGFDEELTRHLPNPVHGIIFLFRYRDAEDETAALPKCPQNIWFANQIAENSCATIAMLNILMNSQDIDLGQVLSDFKAFTMNKKSPWRGLHLKNNASIRVVHNSFVRRVEVLSADLALQQEFEKWDKTEKSKATAKKRKATLKKKTAKQQQQDDEAAAFHYVAYVPINGQVWRMDGMQKNPVNLGAYTGNWLSLARENVQIQMAMHPDDEEYNFLAVCRAPLATICNSLASNAHAIQLIEDKLTTITPDWRSFIATPDSPPHADPSDQPQNQNHALSPSLSRELCDSYDLSPALIFSSTIASSIAHKLSILSADAQGLMSLRETLIVEEKCLQREYCEEVLEDSDEAETAAMYQVDYGPAMYKLVKGMLDSGELMEVWDSL